MIDKAEFLGQIIDIFNVLAGYNRLPFEGEPAFSYRGSIAEMDWCNGVVYVTTDTAWSPTTEMWDVISDTHFQDKYGDRLIDYVFISEEPGMGLYIKNGGREFSVTCIRDERPFFYLLNTLVCVYRILVEYYGLLIQYMMYYLYER